LLDCKALQARMRIVDDHHARPSFSELSDACTRHLHLALRRRRPLCLPSCEWRLFGSFFYAANVLWALVARFFSRAKEAATTYSQRKQEV
jgi:hypothetical protein